MEHQNHQPVILVLQLKSVMTTLAVNISVISLRLVTSLWNMFKLIIWLHFLMPLILKGKTSTANGQRRPSRSRRLINPRPMSSMPPSLTPAETLIAMVVAQRTVAQLAISSMSNITQQRMFLEQQMLALGPPLGECFNNCKEGLSR
jgi:hypothetical protein